MHSLPVATYIPYCSESSRRLWLFLGSLREFCRKVPGKLLEKSSRIAKCYKFQDFGHRERQTCREPWVHTAGTLSPPSSAGCFSKSTVPAAFSSFSDLREMRKLKVGLSGSFARETRSLRCLIGGVLGSE